MCGTSARTNRSQLTGVWKSSVADAFDRAAEQYDDLANIQRKVAEELAQRVAQHCDVSEIGAGLELGCGTGFLTRHLLPHFANTSWVVSDVSPKMVSVCRQLMEARSDKFDTAFRALDAEQLDSLTEASLSFDLICSSLAFQWFTDLSQTLIGLFDRLNDKGQIHFTTLADTNFRCLYDHFALSGLEQRAPRFPSVSEIENGLKNAGAGEIVIDERRYSEAYPDLQTLLRHLKSIGAATPGQHADSTEMAAFQRSLRKAIRESRESGHRVVADYHVLFVSAKKSG